MSVEVTRLRRGQESEVVEVITKSFRSFSRYGLTVDEWLNYSRIDPGVKPENTYVITYDGRVAGVVQIVERRIKLVNSAILVAGIANVCIDPDYRGKGLGKVLLGETLKDLSRRYLVTALLAGFGSHAHSIYQRLGFVDVYFTEKVVVPPVQLEPWRRIKFGGSFSVRRASESDIDNLKRLYEGACKSLVGVVERDATLWKRVLKFAPLHTFFYGSESNETGTFVVERSGDIIGYFSVHSWKDSRGLLEPGLSVVKEAVALPGYERAVIAAALSKASGRIVEIFTPHIEHARDFGSYFTTQETYMFKVLRAEAIACIEQQINAALESIGVHLRVSLDEHRNADAVVKAEGAALAKLLVMIPPSEAGAVVKPCLYAPVIEAAMRRFRRYIFYVDRW